MSDDNERIVCLLQQILDKLSAQTPVVPLSAQLWDTEAISAYLKRSYSTVRDTILPQPSFPKAIRLPGKGRSYPLYKASEVMLWAEGFQSK